MPELITIKESSRILEVSERTIRRMIRDNNTLTIRGKQGRAFLVDKDSVLAIKQNKSNRAEWVHPGY